MTGRGEAIPRDRLHTLLDQLLDSATTDGKLQSDAFWIFVAGLAQGRGIGDALHAAAEHMARAVASDHPSPVATLETRQRRAYHIGLLIQLLADIGLPSKPSVLPDGFEPGLIVSDLQAMLKGPGGMGEARPQILTSNRRGLGVLRRHARRVLVGAALWRQAHERTTLASVVARLGLNTELFDAWLREFGGASGDLAQAARASGTNGDASNSYWSAPDEDLVPLVKLARTAQGVGERKPLGRRHKKVT